MKRNYGDLTMKAQLILIASALFLVSNIAGAQEPEAPMGHTGGHEMGYTGGQDTMGHMGGGMMGGEDTMGHMGGGMMGGEDTMGHMGGGMMCHGMMGHGMMGHGMFKRMIFALMDTDGDGTISLEEFQAAHAKIFKAMDTNKDGKLTPAEIEAFMTGGSPAPNQ
jgi:EF hand domain-containing protein